VGSVGWRRDAGNQAVAKAVMLTAVPKALRAQVLGVGKGLGECGGLAVCEGRLTEASAGCRSGHAGSERSTLKLS
jgi:hypothetical protein